MTRIEPLTDEEMGDSIDFLKLTIERLGFLPNSQRIMAHKPELLIGINELYKAIMHRSEGSLPPGLMYLVGNASSLAAGCMYCVAHSGGAAGHNGIEEEKLAAIWEYETSDLFSEAERAAIRFAQASSSIPNMVTDADFEDLKSTSPSTRSSRCSRSSACTDFSTGGTTRLPPRSRTARRRLPKRRFPGRDGRRASMRADLSRRVLALPVAVPLGYTKPTGS